MDLQHFLAVILVQFIVFVALWRRLKNADAARILLYSCAIGIPFGIAFDLIVGKYVGIFSYHLGFGLPFLIINGALSFGLMIATMTLVRRFSFTYIYFVSAIVGLFYEVANTAFPVWIWQFSDSVVLQNLILVFAAYPGLALLMALAMHPIYRFKIFS